MSLSAQAAISYLDFTAFLDGLSGTERDHLAAQTLLFVYPVLQANRFELIEQPVGQRQLMASCQAAGCRVDHAIAHGSAGQEWEITRSPGASDTPPQWVVLNPMIALWPLLGDLCQALRTAFPDATLVVHTSDQHQHEKLIGGPRAPVIAQKLLDQVATVDAVLIGFAEHSLLSLVLGQPSELVLHRRPSTEPAPRGAYFTMDSLPRPSSLSRSAAEQKRGIRVQRGRGCLAPCTYCIEGQANRVAAGERPWDGAGISGFVQHINALSQAGYFFINLIDSSFEDPGRRGIDDLRLFCRMLVGQRIEVSIKMHLRAETVQKLSDDDLVLLKSAGIDVLVIGIESGSNEELAFFHKIADRETSQASFKRLEQNGQFATILGYMMFGPTTTMAMLNEKIAFLGAIGRGWDFLNLTNRVLVFWGSRMHDQLIERGLADDDGAHLGWVPYRFADPAVAVLAERFDALKRASGVYARLNNRMYDAINLESRLLNPAHRSYRQRAGERFDRFQQALRAREAALSQRYVAAFSALLADPTHPFIGEDEIAPLVEELDQDMQTLLAFLDPGERPETLQLQTWMSAVNALGTGGPR